MGARVVRTADRERIRWRNDGGWTRDIARDSPNEHGFTWRVSIADVETDGPFSIFAGFDRLLVLLDGIGMDLVSEGARMQLRPATPRARFAGELGITAELLDGPTVDFNVIWDRSRYDAAEIDEQSGVALGAAAGSVVIAHVLSGALSVGDHLTATSGQTIVDESGNGLRLDGEGEAIVVVLTPILEANSTG